MTQPQDKMRAEFEAWAKDCGYQKDELARCKIGIVSPEYYNQNTEYAWQAWQAACAQQSAQSQQDALDAARYRWLRNNSSTRDGMTDCQAVARMVGFTQFPTLTMESRIHDPDSAIDALIAAQGASNV